jgi:hypothetical protein
MVQVLVPAARMERWVLNFNGRHAACAVAVAGGALTGAAADGSTFVARLPFDGEYVGLPDPAAFAAAAHAPATWGVLLVRKGGFAVARLEQAASVGTKAGGQSQQRFARRRDNQARQAYEAAADHAARILGDVRGPVVTGGDHEAVKEVLADPRLRGLEATGPWLAVPDPRRGILDQAVLDAQAIQVDVTNA